MSDENPYQSPQAESAEAEDPLPELPPIVPTRITAGEVYAAAWPLFQLRWAEAVYSSFAPGWIFICARFLLEVVEGATPPGLFEYMISFLFLLIGVMTWLKASENLLDAVRPYDPSKIEPTRWPRLTLSRFIVYLAFSSITASIMLGTMLPDTKFAVFGVAIVYALSPFLLILVDRRAGPLEAATTALRLLTGNAKPYLMVCAINLILLIAGFFAWYVGLFVTAPFVGLAVTIAYFKMSGQPIAD